jgi:hypothetical protein
LVGVSLSYSGRVFLQSSLGVWYAPHLLIQVFLSSHRYVQFYTHIGNNVWFKFGGIKEQNTIQYFAILFLSMLFILNSDSYFICELNMMNTWSLDYMMWLSLIKSSEGLNRNFSTKSQNQIGFKFGFCICLGIWIITFASDITLQWNWWRWEANKMYNKYVKNSVSQIRTFTLPKWSRNKRVQFWTNLESFSYLHWSSNLVLGQEDSRDNFSEITRASRPLLISINRPLNIEERHIAT